MGNMSYCRWENTLHDVQDCLASLDENDKLSESESSSRFSLFDVMIAYLEEAGCTVTPPEAHEDMSAIDYLNEVRWEVEEEEEEEEVLRLSGDYHSFTIPKKVFVVINSHGKTSIPFFNWTDAQAYADECNAEYINDNPDNTSFWVEAQERN